MSTTFPSSGIMPPQRIHADYHAPGLPPTQTTPNHGPPGVLCALLEWPWLHSISTGMGTPPTSCMLVSPTVPSHEITAYAHTRPSSLSSVDWCTTWLPSTHFLIDTKSIFTSRRT